MSDRPRYIIGIDLGTTNTAVAYVDTRAADPRVRVFDVPQLVAPGQLEPRRQLPSFVYLAGEHDLSPAETALPWAPDRRQVVGELARAQGARVASRMVASAKSWLCHGGVDRNAPILPWGSDSPDKLSPVAASALVLRHVREAWDHVHAGEPDAAFIDQEIVVTVPASFDEAARELTVRAAESAGISDAILLEEPQAAFYAWIESHPGDLRKRALQPGDRVLVFDIGGGTTDFTLIAVGDGDELERTAVGDHLLLGGDNIDLTLAKQIEARIVERRGKKLDALQWHALVHACRLAKERLLGDDSVDRVPIAVAGRGSKLIGGTIKEEIDRSQLEATVLDGFFPLVDAGAVPVRARGGLQEFGLPYAADPAVTRHLAHFLARHGTGQVDAVLFNGGAMTPASLRRRVLAQIERWQPDAGAPRELANDVPELAVAKGAAYYGLVRRGLGARIRGGTPRSFYVGVGAAAGAADDGPMAVCLAPRGLDEGATVELPRDFTLTTNRPVSFKLYSSTTRRDEPGAIVRAGDGDPDRTDDDSDLLELPPIVTVLRAPGRSTAHVRLQVHVTALGTLELWCVEHTPPAGKEPERWRLSFDMRSGGAARRDDAPAGEIDDATRDAQAFVRRVFRGEDDVKPAQLMRALEKRLDLRRDEWSLTVSRALFDAALDVEGARERSAEVEARWLNLCGFTLRPGHGAPLDDWRCKQMWRVFNEGLVHDRAEQCRLAWWIAWRRIAGGLTKGQQEQIYDRLAQLFLPGPKQKAKWHKVKPTKQEAAEMWRVLANLERIDADRKAALGDELVDRLQSRKARSEATYFWALGRIGNRAPLYGPLNAVVPAARVERWIERLLEVDWPAPELAAFPLAQLGRRTGDRARDIDPALRERLAARLEAAPNGERCARLVREVVSLEAREERVALGDSLPPGLRLVADDAA
ncbi:MAG: molecular chaperone DnaK [Deltaproteobacteria bacterium]|nr:MAG: molecular chaperone DnaK [Deltaproteobacteria bacterium]